MLWQNWHCLQWKIKLKFQKIKFVHAQVNLTKTKIKLKITFDFERNDFLNFKSNRKYFAAKINDDIINA